MPNNKLTTKNSIAYINRIATSTICALLLLLSAGCQKDSFTDNEDCQFSLSLTTDSQITMLTRATEEAPLTPPDANQFAVQISNPGGKILKEWEHYSEVSNPIKIQTGTFTLKAFHGEQHTGAFDKPYFEGTSKFGVRRGQQTDVSVVCYLANVMVTTSYTDKFTAFFSDYTISICSSGEPLLFTPKTNGTAFFEPGPLSVIVSVTKQDGTSFSFPAAQIEKTKAKEYYRFKFDLAGDPGNEKLQVSFDASTIDTPISIDISQGWIAGEPPVFNNTGFTNGQQFSNMEGEASVNEISTLIMAPSRIKSCKLTTTSDPLILAGWPAKEIELTTADAGTKAKLRKMGLRWTERLQGLNMAQINFTGLVPLLPGGPSDVTHTFTVTTTDDWGQICSQPQTLSFITASPSFTLQPHNDIWVKETEMNFDLSITKGNIEQIKLQYNNGKEDTWSELPHTHTGGGNNYTLATSIRFTSPDAKIRAIYGSGKTSEIAFNVINPTFQIAQIGLPFAKRISLNLMETNGDFLSRNLEAIKSELKIKIKGKENDNVVFIPTVGSDNTIHFDISGLDANTLQQLQISYDGGIGESASNSIEFMTEEILQIPNAGFENWTTTTIPNVSQGGRQVSQSFFGQNTWSAAPKVSVATFETGETEHIWTTINKRTANPSANTLNTWYIVSSTTKTSDAHKGSAACIRNVAWHNNGGAVPDNTPKWNSSPGTPNAPNTLNRSAGKLFLGSFENDTEHEGIPFKSRPIGLKFYYKYLPKPNTNDKGLIRISIKASDGTEIGHAQASINKQDNYDTPFEIKFNYNNITQKGATICILFASSDEKIAIETSNDMTNYISTGSELYIDDIELIY